MCGIFSYLSNTPLSENFINLLKNESDKLTHRGPDNTRYFFTENIFMGFYRLAINDLSENGNQPFHMEENNNQYTLICNGEIYNHQELATKYDCSTTSNSDCEIILHLFKKIGFRETISQLDGVFSCILLHNDIMYIARDPIGVRPLFMGTKGENLLFASELKSIHGLSDSIIQFPPGTIWNSNERQFISYYPINKLYEENNFMNEEDILKNINNKFTSAVEKRLMSDRPIGCLLSGGLDSSLVAGLLQQRISGKLRTFSIGLEGATDLEYARMVAEHIGSDHTEVIVTEQDMLDAIPEVIKAIESYDTTTVRASTPMYLLSQYIKKNTDIIVIYSGEGSDEASGSYLYFHNAPNEIEFRKETNRLMCDLSYFDVLRCDRTTAAHSLEVRVPFLDKNFLQYYMNIEPSMKHPNYGSIEKYLLRKAFDNGLLPNQVLWRTKEAFSDGVSHKENSWYRIIQDKVDQLYNNEQFLEKKTMYTHNTPMIKESLYYRDLFHIYYPQRDTIIPYYWLPKWNGDIQEPSARILHLSKV